MALCMLLYVILHLTPVTLIYGEAYNHATTAVFYHGVPDLGREIRQKIRTVTAQPSTAEFHSNRQVAAQSRGYEVVEHEPYVETAKYSKKGKSHDHKGEEYDMTGSEKSSGHHDKHHSESGKKGHSGKESSNKKYEDETGKKTEYKDEDGFHKEHHSEGGGGGENAFKHGGKRDKGHVHKGFHDIYRKDERKKSDSFWSNEHKEGKWFKYGSHKHKHDQDKKSKKEKKERKESKDEDSYKKEKKCTKC